jgi:hypothetical protein
MIRVLAKIVSGTSQPSAWDRLANLLLHLGLGLKFVYSDSASSSSYPLRKNGRLDFSATLLALLVNRRRKDKRSRESSLCQIRNRLPVLYLRVLDCMPHLLRG